MKKTILILIISVLTFTTNISAQYCISTVDNISKNINCGDSVQLSSDFFSMAILTSGTNKFLSSVFFTDIITGYVVGDNGTVLKTIDAGVTWGAMSSGTTNSLRSVYFKNSNTGYVVGDGGIILKTINAGNNWTTIPSGTTNSLFSVCFPSPNIGYAVGDNGTIIKTTNAGNTWTLLSSGATDNLCSVFFTDTVTGYAVGYNGSWHGIIIKTCNGGDTWSVLPSGTTYPLLSIFFTDANTGYASALIKTINSGLSWTSLTIPSQLQYVPSSVFFTDANNGYAVGGFGEIIKTYNAGNLWTQLPIITDNYLSSIFFVDHYNGYIVGDTGTIIKISYNNATYNWQPSNGLSNQNISSPFAKPKLTTTYTLTITPNSYTGCNAYTDSVTVFVSPINVNTTSTSGTLCGDSSQLNATTNFINPTYTYLWSPTQGLNNPNIKNPKASPSANTNYKVTLSTNNGCGSPKDSTTVSLTPLPTTQICIVTVANNKNKIYWEKPVESVIDSFYVYKETEVTNVYQKIGVTSYNDSSLFVDNASNADIQSNKYQISIKDKCLLESPKSSAHKTMHLTINQGMGTTWNLIWEPYEGFTVSTYRILRGTTPSNLTLIGTTSGSSTQYTDNTAPAGYIYYQLEVISPILCNPAKSINTSVSNIATNNPITNITEPNSMGSISIYPNPVRNELIIEIEGNNESINFEIYNSIGQVVYKGNLIEKTVVQTNDFTPGVYLIKLDNNKSFEFRKIIKE